MEAVKFEMEEALWSCCVCDSGDRWVRRRGNDVGVSGQGRARDEQHRSCEEAERIQIGYGAGSRDSVEELCRRTTVGCARVLPAVLERSGDEASMLLFDSCLYPAVPYKRAELTIMAGRP